MAGEFRTLVYDTVWCFVRVGFVQVEIPTDVIEHGVALRVYPGGCTFCQLPSILSLSTAAAIDAIDAKGDNYGC